MEAREATTIFYVPTLPTNAPGEEPANERVTVTVTETVAPTGRGTRTIGQPWTTATPSLQTPYWNPTAEVIAWYPPQPTIHWCYTPSATGRIVGAYFGGLGTGLVLSVLILVLMKLFRRRKAKRNARSGLQGLGSVREGEGEVLFDKALLETPKGKGIQLPLDDPEGEPLLVGRSEGN